MQFVRRFVLRYPLSSLVLFGFVSGAVGIYVAPHIVQSQGTQASSNSVRLSDGDYPLVSPLLLCGQYGQKSAEDAGLEKQVQTFVNDKKAKGQVDTMSVYIIDYGAHQWAGVNLADRYDPASMLKVPIMIAYYQLAEKDSSLLDSVVAFQGDDQNTGEYFHSQNDITPNTNYTVSQLIESMITNSDNTAAALLEQTVGQRTLSDVYVDLGLPVPTRGANVEYLSVELYAYFFRLLYNATYLTHADSEKALELLTKTTFAPGIRAGVPAGISVADKFGERTLQTADGKVLDRELHDCGIVYKPDHPYLLCVMSKGTNVSFDVLAKNIADLSEMVYKTIQ